MECEHCPDCKIQCKECKLLFFNREIPKHTKTCKEQMEKAKLERERNQLNLSNVAQAGAGAANEMVNPLLPH